jgi:tetratricopeptide (TPR) repeat protein
MMVDWSNSPIVGAVIQSLAVLFVGMFVTRAYQRHQIRVQELQTITSLMPYLTSGEKEHQKLAVIAIYQMGNHELARRLAVSYPTEGSGEALDVLADLEKHEKGGAANNFLKLTARTFLRMAEHAYNRGDYALALSHSMLCVRLRTKLDGQDHERTAEAMDSAGSALVELGRYEEGEEYLSRALEIRRQTLGEYHHFTGESYHNVGAALFRLEEHENAIYHLQKAVVIFERASERNLLVRTLCDLELCVRRLQRCWRKVVRSISLTFLGEEISAKGHSLGFLSRIFREQGHMLQAEDIADRSLRFLTRLSGERSVDAGLARGCKACVLKSQGKLVDSEDEYLQSIQVLEESLGKDAVDLGYAQTGLGELYLWQGRLRLAEATLTKAIEIRSKRLPDEHPERIRDTALLAQVQCDLGNYSTALLMLESVLKSSDHSCTGNRRSKAWLWALNDRGVAHFKLGNYSQAERDIREALKIKELLLGSGHVDVAFSQMSLADLLLTKWKLGEAMDLYKSSYRVFEDYFGAEHLRTLHCRIGLTELKRITHEPGADKDFEDMWRIANENPELACHSLLIGSICDGLAGCYRDDGSFELAIRYYKESAKQKSKEVGESSPELIRTINGLGMTYLKRFEASGKQDTSSLQLAQEQFERALKIASSFGLCASHDYVTYARYCLGRVLVAQGDEKQGLETLLEALGAMVSAFTLEYRHAAIILMYLGAEVLAKKVIKMQDVLLEDYWKEEKWDLQALKKKIEEILEKVYDKDSENGKLRDLKLVESCWSKLSQ